MSLCSKKRTVGEVWNITKLLQNSLLQKALETYCGAYYSSSLFGLLMLSLWDTESMLTKQTGWCYLMSSREHIECSTRLIYIGLALRQKWLFIKMTTTALRGLVAWLLWPTAPHHHPHTCKHKNHNGLYYTNKHMSESVGKEAVVCLTQRWSSM